MVRVSLSSWLSRGLLAGLVTLVVQATAFAQLPPQPAPAPAPTPASANDAAEPPSTGRAHIVTPPSGNAAEKLHWLIAQIDSALADPQLQKAKVGIALADTESGKLLYGKNEHELFNPASNTKLFTTAAALGTLGPEYRYKTVVFVDGGVQNGEVKGKIYLKGYGDPTLVVEDLWKVTSDLWAAGVRKVSGDLVVDDTFFDDVRLGPGFDQKQEDAVYRAPNGALSVNYNAVSVHVLAGAADSVPARVVIDPVTPYFVITNEARTIATGRTQITIESQDADGVTKLIVKGRIRLRDDVTQLKRVAYPDLYTANMFKELLSRHGIKLSGAIVRGIVPTTARALVVHYSQPLGIIVREVNKRSNNFMAEQIIKTLGAETGGKPGTWKKGVDGVAAYLEKIGIKPSDYKLTNGSGLYDSNRFTPLQMVTLLVNAYKDFRFAADFLGSLAVAGTEGTIGHRMAGGFAERYVRAKTGTLQGVSCLAGYAGAETHVPVSFAIFFNDLSDKGNNAARGAQDQIAEAIVAYLSSK